MAKLNSTSAFALFAKDSKVNVTPKNGGDKFPGFIRGFRDDKQMFSIERSDDPEKVVLIPAERISKRQGRPAGSKNGNSAKAETQTSAKSGAKGKAKQTETESNELSVEDFDMILNALQTMKERTEANNVEMARILEENQEIEQTYGDMISGLEGHIAFLNEGGEAEEEASDEAEEVEEKAAPKSLLKRRPMAKADADEEG